MCWHSAAHWSPLLPKLTQTAPLLTSLPVWQQSLSCEHVPPGEAQVQRLDGAQTEPPELTPVQQPLLQSASAVHVA